MKLILAEYINVKKHWKHSVFRRVDTVGEKIYITVK